MAKTFQRILSFLMAVMLCVSMLPTSAFAAEADTGEDTEPSQEVTETTEAPAEESEETTVPEESEEATKPPQEETETTDVPTEEATEAPSEELETPCAHGRAADCAICRVEQLIEALPKVEELKTMSQEEQQAIYNECLEATEAWEVLLEEEQEQVSNLQKLIDLHSYFNAQIEPVAVPDAYPLPALTGNQAKDVVAIAASQLGYTENPGTIYGQWWTSITNWGVDYTNLAWCGMFVCWCANKAGAGLGIAYDKNGASANIYRDL